MAAVLAEPRNHIWDEITELGLEKYVADMDHDGFCTLPPEIANPNNLARAGCSKRWWISPRNATGNAPISRPAQRMPINPNSYTAPRTSGTAGHS